METIIELVKAFERITKDKVTRLDIQYNSISKMYTATLDFENFPFRFCIKEDGTVIKDEWL